MLKQKKYYLSILLILGIALAIIFFLMREEFNDDSIDTKKEINTFQKININATSTEGQFDNVENNEIGKANASISEKIEDSYKSEINPVKKEISTIEKKNYFVKKVTPEGEGISSKNKCDIENFENQFLCLLNYHRSSNGKRTLKYDLKLSEVALGHSKWMELNNKMSHIGENNSKYFERCSLNGVKCDAENIAYYFASAEELFGLWRDSMEHNEIMLGDHDIFGIGISGKYATALFF